MTKKPGEFDLSAVAVKGMKDISAVGISYRYAAPEAFNRMYQKNGFNDEGKPVGKYGSLYNLRRFRVRCYGLGIA
jgi:hypothetical protein